MTYSGVVQKGAGVGRTFGFPTANIPLPAGVFAGVYVAKVSVGEKVYHAAVYANKRRSLLEAHLLHFDGDLYGKEIEVDLLKKIRNDLVFHTADEARKYIAEDVQKAYEYFKVP